jgi:hypothetical protein
MKRHILCSLLVLSISGNLLAAASKYKFQPVVAQMHEHFNKQSCDDAEATLRAQGRLAEGELASGAVPGIYYGLKDLGYQGFADANQAVIEQSLKVITCVDGPTDELIWWSYPLAVAARSAFQAAAAQPDNVDLWVNELKIFSRALLDMARRSPYTQKFKPAIKIADRIAANHGIEGTEEEVAAIAAFQMVVPIRFNQRFEAMNLNVATFQAFMARVPAVFAELEQEATDHLAWP